MSFKVSLSDKAKTLLLDLIMEQCSEAQNMVKDLMGQAFEEWLLKKISEAPPEAEPEAAEDIPLSDEQ